MKVKLGVVVGSSTPNFAFIDKGMGVKNPKTANLTKLWNLVVVGAYPLRDSYEIGVYVMLSCFEFGRFRSAGEKLWGLGSFSP